MPSAEPIVPSMRRRDLHYGQRGTLIGSYNFGPNAETYGKPTPDERRARAVSYYIAWQAGASDSARKVVTEIHARVVAAPGGRT